MAIRYTKDLNAKIRKEVKNFNARRKILSKRGIKLTPAPLKVSDLKARYQSRRDLERELGLLSKASSRNDSLLKEVENSGGATAIEWELQYLKINEQKAKEYFERERKIVASKVGRFPGERMRLDNIEQKIALLDLDKDYMNQDQFNSYRSIIREYMSIPAKMKGGYRGFLIEVEESMTRLGYSKESINKVFNKLSKLSPSQFHQFYEENDLVGRIYELIQSPKHGGSNDFTTTEEDAEDKIATFIEELDDNIAKYKNL